MEARRRLVCSAAGDRGSEDRGDDHQRRHERRSQQAEARSLGRERLPLPLREPGAEHRDRQREQQRQRHRMARDTEQCGAGDVRPTSASGAGDPAVERTEQRDPAGSCESPAEAQLHDERGSDEHSHATGGDGRSASSTRRGDARAVERQRRQQEQRVRLHECKQADEAACDAPLPHGTARLETQDEPHDEPEAEVVHRLGHEVRGVRVERPGKREQARGYGVRSGHHALRDRIDERRRCDEESDVQQARAREKAVTAHGRQAVQQKEQVPRDDGCVQRRQPGAHAVRVLVGEHDGIQAGIAMDDPRNDERGRDERGQRWCDDPSRPAGHRRRRVDVVHGAGTRHTSPRTSVAVKERTTRMLRRCRRSARRPAVSPEPRPPSSTIRS